MEIADWLTTVRLCLVDSAGSKLISLLELLSRTFAANSIHPVDPYSDSIEARGWLRGLSWIPGPVSLFCIRWKEAENGRLSAAISWDWVASRRLGNNAASVCHREGGLGGGQLRGVKEKDRTMERNGRRFRDSCRTWQGSQAKATTRAWLSPPSKVDNLCNSVVEINFISKLLFFQRNFNIPKKNWQQTVGITVA